jgi:hypothetical protein
VGEQRLPDLGNCRVGQRIWHSAAGSARCCSGVKIALIRMYAAIKSLRRCSERFLRAC